MGALADAEHLGQRPVTSETVPRTCGYRGSQATPMSFGLSRDKRHPRIVRATLARCESPYRLETDQPSLGPPGASTAGYDCPRFPARMPLASAQVTGWHVAILGHRAIDARTERELGLVHRLRRESLKRVIEKPTELPIMRVQS
jgi:hypothetical protein